MEEWQRQWEAMKTDGKNPDEFWKKQWAEWHKDRLAGRNPEWKGNPNAEQSGKGDSKQDDPAQQPRSEEFRREMEKEFWQKAWDSHKDQDDKWNEPGSFMGPYFQNQWSQMKNEGKSPEEFWKNMWEEMNEHSQSNESSRHAGGKMSDAFCRSWMKESIQEKWRDMEKNGKSPADFWKSVKDDMHSEDEKSSFFRRFFERRMDKKLDEFMREGKSPDEIWKNWGEHRPHGGRGCFRSWGHSQRGDGEWKPWMFEHGDRRGMGSGCGRRGFWNDDFTGQHGCHFRGGHRHRRTFKEYDERPIFKEFDF